MTVVGVGFDGGVGSNSLGCPFVPMLLIDNTVTAAQSVDATTNDMTWVLPTVTPAPPKGTRTPEMNESIRNGSDGYESEGDPMDNNRHIVDRCGEQGEGLVSSD